MHVSRAFLLARASAMWGQKRWPEAIGKLRTGDLIEIKIDCRELHGEVNFLGTRSDEQLPSQEEATAILNARPSHQDLLPILNCQMIPGYGQCFRP